MASARSLGHEHWVINLTTGIGQTCLHILYYKIRQFIHDLDVTQPRLQKVQYIGNADAHSSNAGTSSTLARIKRDSIKQFHLNTSYTLFVRSDSTPYSQQFSL